MVMQILLNRLPACIHSGNRGLYREKTAQILNMECKARYFRFHNNQLEDIHDENQSTSIVPR